MSTPNPANLNPIDQGAVKSAVDQACALIAPTWPLDAAIAVNPWWPMIDRRPETVDAQLGVRSGARLTMPRAYYQQRWQQGDIAPRHLRQAAFEAGQPLSEERLLWHLEQAPLSARLPLMTDLADSRRDPLHQMTWGEEVTHQISQFCAAWFDRGQAAWGPSRERDPYPVWRDQTARDRGLGLLMQIPRLHERFASLPDTPMALIAGALESMAVAPEHWQHYLHSLLLSINGWASWCAYEHWQARLDNRSTDLLSQLLAMRLAWEQVLFTEVAVPEQLADWHQSLARAPEQEQQLQQDRALDWVWQCALELGYQDDLVGRLAAAGTPQVQTGTPALQAVFCIDVRSEVFRRALEASDEAIVTLGYAGFFGLPLAYAELGSDQRRAQLPGLLAPSLVVGDSCQPGDPDSNRLGRMRRARLAAADRWRQFRTAGPGSFSYVEATGLLYGLKLIKDGLLGGSKTPTRAGLKPKDQARLQPGTLCHGDTGNPLSDDEKVNLAAGILRSLGLVRDFAPLVLLVGHGSQSANNPQAAALDCGACCGQTGEVNARLLAALLNRPQVRAGLADQGIVIPEETRFLGALHNTTTDEVSLFEDAAWPAPPARLEQARHWLDQARSRAQDERAPALGLAGARDTGLDRELHSRSRDWSQVRPEWGLAGNAAFIMAPRSLTRNLDLAGRSFLHDYRWQDDDGFAVLEGLMTAPMIVTHWINMQYYASTVDNLRLRQRQQGPAQCGGRQPGAIRREWR